MPLLDMRAEKKATLFTACMWRHSRVPFDMPRAVPDKAGSTVCDVLLVGSLLTAECACVCVTESHVKLSVTPFA